MLMKLEQVGIGVKVEITPEANDFWAGEGVIERIGKVGNKRSEQPIVVVRMTSGQNQDQTGGFCPYDITLMPSRCYCGNTRNEDDYACNACKSGSIMLEV